MFRVSTRGRSLAPDHNQTHLHPTRHPPRSSARTGITAGANKAHQGKEGAGKGPT